MHTTLLLSDKSDPMLAGAKKCICAILNQAVCNTIHNYTIIGKIYLSKNLTMQNGSTVVFVEPSAFAPFDMENQYLFTCNAGSAETKVK